VIKINCDYEAMSIGAPVEESQPRGEVMSKDEEDKIVYFTQTASQIYIPSQNMLNLYNSVLTAVTLPQHGMLFCETKKEDREHSIHRVELAARSCDFRAMFDHLLCNISIESSTNICDVNFLDGTPIKHVHAVLEAIFPCSTSDATYIQGMGSNFRHYRFYYHPAAGRVGTEVQEPFVWQSDKLLGLSVADYRVRTF
jgi:hypothetical protein